MRHLYGLATSPNSLPTNSGGGWMPWPQDSHALPSATPGKSSGPRTPAGCGRRSCVFYGRLRPDGSYSRTSRGYEQLSLEGLTVTSSPVWPVSGSMRSGSLWERTPWRPRTDGRGCSSSDDGMWLTLATFQGKWRLQARKVERDEPLLPAQAEMWATPRANEKGQHNSEDNGVALSRMASRWPTPNVSDSPGIISPSAARLDRRRGNMERNQLHRRVASLYTNEESPFWPTPVTGSSKVFRTQFDGRQGLTLMGRVEKWMTPTARDWRDGSLTADSPVPTNSLLGRQVLRSGPQVPRTWPLGPPSLLNGRTSRLQLNPRFVEWLMGLPVGWTEPRAMTASELLEMRSYLSKARRLSEFFTAD
jgi:hypothetical protein